MPERRPNPWWFNLLFGTALGLAAWLFWEAATDREIFYQILYRSIAIGFFSLTGFAILDLLPPSRYRTALEYAIAIPLFPIVILGRIYRAIAIIVIAFFLMVSLQAVVWMGAWHIVGLETLPQRVVLYLSLSGTLLMMAYHPRWLGIMARVFEVGWNPTGAEEDVQYIMHVVESRRLLYQVGLIVFILSAGVRLGPWEFLEGSFLHQMVSIGLEAFLTFFAIDTYLAQFHPQLLPRGKATE